MPVFDYLANYDTSTWPMTTSWYTTNTANYVAPVAPAPPKKSPAPPTIREAWLCAGPVASSTPAPVARARVYTRGEARPSRRVRERRRILSR